MKCLSLTLSMCVLIFSSTCSQKNDSGPGECQSETDCVTLFGQAEQGCDWICSYQECNLVGECEGADTPPDNPPVEKACSVAADCQDQQLPSNCTNGSWECVEAKCRSVCGDPNNQGCLSDRINIPQGGNCDCSCVDCDCTGIDCTCDLTCYGQADCLINSDSNGNASTNDSFLGNCELSCTPEDDLSDQMYCSASNCVIPPSQIQLTPEKQSTPGSKSIDREIKDAGMLILVDPSGSMTSDQMASACAMDAFFQEAEGAEYSIGVGSMDVSDQYNHDTGEMTDPPAHLVGLEGGSCDSYLQCDCSQEFSGSVCAMTPDGQMVSSTDPNAEDLLRKLIVMGDNEESGSDEAGLEKAFLLVFENIKLGRPDEISQVVAISDESANDDDRICGIQSHRYDATNLANLKAVLGQDFSPPANTGDCDTDLTNFYIYFFTRYNIQVNALAAVGGCGERCDIYPKVAAATGGILGDICSCESFVDFFSKVGVSTNTISTQLCLDEAIDPNSLGVVYTEGGASQTVPRSDTDGWSYDSNLNCIILNGSWASKYGTFEISYNGLEQQVSSVVCFPAGVDPIPDSIRVSYQGQVVPQDSTNGWTFDPTTDCISFHGTWAGVPGPFDIEYL